jgi:hypothetical protein
MEPQTMSHTSKVKSNISQNYNNRSHLFHRSILVQHALKHVSFHGITSYRLMTQPLQRNMSASEARLLLFKVEVT